MNDVKQYFRQITKQSVLVILVFVMGMGCRGYRSSEPPVHLNPNLDFQAKYKAQSLSLTPPENTVPWGTIFDERRGFVEKEAFYTGLIGGRHIRKAPVSVDEKLLNRGQERFNIYCAVCHSKTGNGGTPVIQRGYLPPPKLSDSRLLTVSDGYLFSVITNGVRSMPGYKSQVSVEDRWAIVVYVRALQKMYFGRIDDVPYSDRSKIEK